MAVTLSRNIVVGPQGVDDSDHARLLIDNVFRRGTVTASSENGLNNGWFENAIDGLTFDWWEPTSLPATLSVELTEVSPVDCGLIAVHDGLTYVFQYWDGADWVNLHEPVVTTTTAVSMVIFSEITALDFRIQITASEQTPVVLGVVMLGKAITMPRPFYGGHAPITLNRKTEIKPYITEGGFEKGIMTLRTGAASSVTVRHCPAAWVRENLENINNELRNKPFGFAWRPASEPNDVAYCWLNKEITATNNGNNSRMDLQFDFEAYVGGFALAPVFETFLMSMFVSPWAAIVDVSDSSVSYSSSPDLGFSGEVDNRNISANRNGLVMLSSGGDGGSLFRYRSGEWTLLQDAFGELTGIYRAVLHPDGGNWMLITTENTRVNYLYKRYSLPGDGVEYIYASTISTGGFAALFSPDGEIFVISLTTSFRVYEFDSETGVYSLVDTETIGQGNKSYAMESTSQYLAAINSSTFGGVDLVKVYKRNEDNTFTRLTLNLDSQPFGQTSQNATNFVDWHPTDGFFVVGGGDYGLLTAYKNDGSDEFNEVTATIFDAQPGVGGRIAAVKFSRDGSTLLVSTQGSTSPFVVYSYAGGRLIRQFAGGTGDRAYGLTFQRFSNTATLSVIPPDVTLDFDLYDESEELVLEINSTGDYTIVATVPTVPDAEVIISRVRFYVDDELLATVEEAPYEAVLEIVEDDDLTTKEIRVDVIDFTGQTTSETRGYEVDFNPPWSPSMIDTAAWYDASDDYFVVVDESDQVTDFLDKSGKANNLGQSSESKMPSLVYGGLNDLNYIEFNGTSDVLTIGSNGIGRNTQQLAFTIVFRPDNVSSDRRIWNSSTGTSSTNARLLIGFNASSRYRVGGRRTDAGSYAENTNVTAASGSWVILTCIYDYGSAELTIRVDGEDFSSGSFLDAGTTSYTNSLSGSLGANPPGNQFYYDGGVAEIVVEHSIDNFLKTEGYLAHKWGLEGNLPVGHPYRDAPP